MTSTNCIVLYCNIKNRKQKKMNAIGEQAKGVSMGKYHHGPTLFEVQWPM